ncbi:class I SAM-dependent methyltransferase [bacterium]|nr:MAG: class I SAM-dependent methyltransferase [bacterium]
METEHERWSRIFSGSTFFYGQEPGSVARRAVKYARSLKATGGNALDAGCGEGQDLLYLAQNGYDCLGLDFTSEGIAKSGLLLEHNGQKSRLEVADLTQWNTNEQFDLVLCINSLQFLGADAPQVLNKLKNLVAPGGVFGFSAFAREYRDENPIEGSIYRFHLDELLLNFADWQPFEAARLWQWGKSGSAPQPFATLVASKI